MDTNLNRVASDLVDEKLGEFPNLVIKDRDNKPIPTTMDDQTENARIFDFKFVRDGVDFGPVTVTISDNDGLQIKTYSDPVQGKTDEEQDLWYEFVKSMSEFATDHVLKFKGPKVVTKKITPKSEVGESKMTESRLVGTSKTSYQDLGEATLIVKHNKPINYNAANGRTQHIESIYIENALGERFRYPMKHLNGARALASHIIEGGTPYDDIGQYIIGLSEELGKLRMFKGYVTRSPMVAEAMGSVTSRVIERMESIKKELAQLQNRKHYAEWAESFSRRDAKEIPEDMAAEWIDRLTIKSFNEDLKSVFPYLFNIIEESDLPVKELDAQDLLDSMSQVQELVDPEREIRELADLENFVDNIVREDKDSGIFSQDNLRQSEAIEKLNKLIQDNMDAVVGLQGENGKSLIDQLIPDNELLDEIEDRASKSAEGSSTPLWPIVRDFIEFKMPEMLKDNGGALDFEPAPAEAPAEPTAAAPAAAPAAEQPAVPAQESWQGALETKLYKIKALAEQNGRDFDSVRLTINGKSYSLSEALMAFDVKEKNQEFINEGSDDLQNKVAKIMRRFDEKMNEIGGYGDPDYNKIIDMLKQGDIDGALDEVYMSYADQDGGELRRMDDYIEDLRDEFEVITQDGDMANKIRARVAELTKDGEGMEPEDAYQQVADEFNVSVEKLYDILGKTESMGQHHQEKSKKSLQQQILERVKSFTNLIPERIDQGPFPLGEEGVITKVTKDLAEKYGREEDHRFKAAVETYCRECVAKLSSVFETYRMKKLAGMDQGVDESSHTAYPVKTGPQPMAMTSPKPTAIVASKRWSAITPEIEEKASRQGFRKVMLKVNGQLVAGLEGGDQTLGSKILVSADDFAMMTSNLDKTPVKPGTTPEKAKLDPRYKTDPGFKKEVDTASQIQFKENSLSRMRQLAGLN